MLKKDLLQKKRKRGQSNPNTDIPTELKLSIAIRYFAGGDPYDLMADQSRCILDLCVRMCLARGRRYQLKSGNVDTVSKGPRFAKLDRGRVPEKKQSRL